MYRRIMIFAAVTAFSTGVFAQTGVAAFARSPDHADLARHAAGRQGRHVPPETNAADPKMMAGRPYIRLDERVHANNHGVSGPKGKTQARRSWCFPAAATRFLSMDLEGTEVCDWLNAIGVTCVLLKYRVPDSGPYPKSAAALQDAQRAMGLVRMHAAEWGIDPHRVGVLGFSAGGHLSAAISNHYEQRLYDPIDAADKLSCRPDFAVVLYPGYLAMAEQNFAPNPTIHPTADTPPTFILQAEDDPVHVENSVVYFLALKNAKVPAELHVYAAGRAWLRAAAAGIFPSWAGPSWWRRGCTPSRCCRRSEEIQSAHADCRADHLRSLLAAG